MLRFFMANLVAISLIFNACQQNPNPPAAAPESAAAPSDTLQQGPRKSPNPWIGRTCDLLTDDEFYATFGVEAKRDVANKRSLPNEPYCLRTWKKSDWREREIIEAKNPKLATNPENMLVIQIVNFETDVMAQEQFASTQRNRVRGLTEAVPNLGEGALWSDTERFLYLKKGHLNVQISLDMADNAHDNLPKAVEVARLVLAKM
jgi:hypothetical protein